MRPGDVIESAVWVTGDEPPELRERYAIDISTAIHGLCEAEGYFCGPVQYHELRPGEDRTPQVPDHIQGSRVRLLVAEATVIGLTANASCH